MQSAFLVAAPHSGSGKTTVALALMAAFRARGLTVQPFKVGPDYIDPSHHAVVAGRPSHNLDTWMLPEEVNREVFERAMLGADVGIVEGVMGLFDGVDGRRPDGSSAELASLLGLPVLLVVDARSMARSAAALVLGFTRFDPALRFAGILWNRIGSPTHLRMLDEALTDAGFRTALGAVPRSGEVFLPERHLGLVTPEEAFLSRDFSEALARLAETSVDLDALLAETRRPGCQSLPEAPPSPAGWSRGEGRVVSEGSRAARVRLAVPRDAAFCFYYEENLRLLESHGAELLFFRPADGDGVPPGAQGAYLGGGYPEVHAQRLSRNDAFRTGLRELHASQRPVYAECGGFMALCRELEDLEGRRHVMTGIYPTTAKMSGRGFRLGYREVSIHGFPGLEGLTARGHEFHYSTIDPLPDSVPRAYRVRNARGEELAPEGYVAGSALGGYVHLHFASNPEIPKRFFGLPGCSDAPDTPAIPSPGR